MEGGREGGREECVNDAYIDDEMLGLSSGRLE